MTGSAPIFARRRYGQDNYAYLLAEGADAVLVDPGDAGAALALAAEHGLRPRWILHTHGHPDHSGGSAEVARALGAEVLGHGGDAGWYRPDVDLAGRSGVTLGALGIAVHAVPGHTPGSQCFLVDGRLVSGDTLFIGGCGRVDLPGSNPEEMYDSLVNKLKRLPEDTVLYPGHNYADRVTSTIGDEKRRNLYMRFERVEDFLGMMGY